MQNRQTLFHIGVQSSPSTLWFLSVKVMEILRGFQEDFEINMNHCDYFKGVSVGKAVESELCFGTLALKLGGEIWMEARCAVNHSSQCCKMLVVGYHEWRLCCRSCT